MTTGHSVETQEFPIKEPNYALSSYALTCAALKTAAGPHRQGADLQSLKASPHYTNLHDGILCYNMLCYVIT